MHRSHMHGTFYMSRSLEAFRSSFGLLPPTPLTRDFSWGLGTRVVPARQFRSRRPQAGGAGRGGGGRGASAASCFFRCAPYFSVSPEKNIGTTQEKRGNIVGEKQLILQSQSAPLLRCGAVGREGESGGMGGGGESWVALCLLMHSPFPLPTPDLPKAS